jgi:hypothetical protein
MISYRNLMAVALASVWILSSVACKPKLAPASAVQPDVTAAAQALPDGASVLAALEKKDYDTAVSTLVKIQQAAGTTQEEAFVTLRQHVRARLLDVADTDPKAAEALNAVRAMTTGGR